MHHHHQQTEAIVKRLARIEGHVRSAKQMLEDGRDCPDVLIQLAAIRAAIDSAGRALLVDHIEHCLREAKEDSDYAQALSELKSALNHFVR